MDGNAVLMRQMATMTKETDTDTETSTHGQGAASEGGTEGGRGVTCIKLLIRFVGSREGRRVGRLCGWLKVCKGRVFYCGTKNLRQRMNCGAPQPIVKVGGAAVVAVVAAAASSCALVS